MNKTFKVNLTQEDQMSAFFIATVTIKDAEKFTEYGGKAGATFAPFGGKLLTKGKAEKTLAGESSHQTAAIVSFPDMAALEGWYQSPEYQALIPLRDSAADMTLVAYAVPA